MLVFRQLIDPQSSTYTYLLGDSQAREAVIIDPVFEQAQRDGALIDELGFELTYTLDTHVHADHVTGAWLMAQRRGCKIALASVGNAENVDAPLRHGDKVPFGKRYLTALSTPGHTSGCMTYVLDDQSMAFTGDCLLIRGAGRTDFQQGDARKLYRSVHEKIFRLPSNCLLYPGHDYRGITVTSVAEERAHNPRLGADIGEDDFAGYMDNLGLAHPKQIDAAVPANLVSGKPEGNLPSGADPLWAPLTYTFAGFWEISPHWVEENRASVQIVDVREETEFRGPLGRINGATHIPLGEITQRATELSKTKPIITVCRAGARSAQAIVLLGRAGFTDLANLTGGMLNWRTQSLPTAGGAE